MSRITPIDPTTATGKTAELFTAVKSKLGSVPNLMRAFGNSPAALEAFLAFKASLSNGMLPVRVREQIALVVAEINACDYCLAAHSMVARNLGLSAESIMSARRAEAGDRKVDALLKFATMLVEHRGQVPDGGLTAVREAGASDAEILEVIGHVSLNIFANYTNHVAQPPMEFPRVTPLVGAGQEVT